MYNVYENINDFLNNYKEECVVFCVANNAVIDMTKNLIISATKNNINIILFALDLEIIDNCKEYCDIVKYIDDTQNIVSNHVYKFGASNFRDVVFQRFFIGNEILKMNKYYVYIDIDVVIYKNFMNDIINDLKKNDYDMLCQTNGHGCCTGFYSMKPNDKTKSLDKDFFIKNNYTEYRINQHFVNQNILKNKVLNCKFLNRDRYPNGKWFYMRCKKIHKDICKIVHYNCLPDYKSKIDKMKKHKSWYL
tara:strand:+ start:275 stop:1018 length:744 start_codon:yes stop_codon:yes gene_type:complete